MHRGLVGFHGILLTGIIVGVLAPSAALGSFPGRNGVVSFTAEGSIWAVDIYTGDGLRLTSGPADSAPSFSPSGNMLAFQRGTGATATVYLARADGSDARPLVRGSEPAFSPSGRKIVFARAGGLFVTDTGPGSPVRQITNHPGDREPQWSTKGTIVFERSYILHVRSRGRIERRVGSELDLITPPSLHVRQILTLGEAQDMWPDWSPHGTILTVALCKEPPAPERESEPELPKLEYRGSCNPSVWAPEGRVTASARAQPGVDIQGVLAESPDGVFRWQHAGKACPTEWSGGAGVSWQPLVAGTMRVPTMPCEYTGYMTGVSPSVEEPNRAQPHRTRSCSVRHHRRHCTG